MKFLLFYCSFVKNGPKTGFGLRPFATSADGRAAHGGPAALLASPLASPGLYFILPRLETSSARGAAWGSTACGPACGNSSALWPSPLAHSRSISAVKADPTAGRQFRRNKTPPSASVHPNPNSFCSLHSLPFSPCLAPLPEETAAAAAVHGGQRRWWRATGAHAGDSPLLSFFLFSLPHSPLATAVSSEVNHGDRRRKEMAPPLDPSPARELALG
jgi:hypothetical protein